MGRRPKFTRRAAVEAALHMIDAEGIEAFTMERLATHLGVRSPSLYHHFTDRAGVLQEVATLVLSMAPVFDDDRAREDWAAELVRVTVGFRRVMLEHRKAAPLLLEHFPRQPLMDVYERAATVLSENGVPEHVDLVLFLGMEKLALGSALSRTEDQGVFPNFEAEGFPAIARAVEAAHEQQDALFEEACFALIDGVKVRLGMTLSTR